MSSGGISPGHARPRPSLRDEEPPAKQLKLSVGEDEVLPASAIFLQSEGVAAGGIVASDHVSSVVHLAVSAESPTSETAQVFVEAVRNVVSESGTAPDTSLSFSDWSSISDIHRTKSVVTEREVEPVAFQPLSVTAGLDSNELDQVSPLVVDNVSVSSGPSSEFTGAVVEQVGNGFSELESTAEVSPNLLLEERIDGLDPNKCGANLAQEQADGAHPQALSTVHVDELDCLDQMSPMVLNSTCGVSPISGIAHEIVGTEENVDSGKEATLDSCMQIAVSEPNGNAENVVHVADVAMDVEAPGKRLPADLGAGTSAAQRTKTSLCSYFRKKGCKHGSACRYAHGEEELKQRPDGSWDPTSERAKSLFQKISGPSVPKEAVAAPTSATVPLREKPSDSEESDKSAVNALSRCIVHIPRGWSVDHFKTFLTECGISYTTAKKRKGMSVAFVGFKTLEDVTKAIEVLDGKCINKKLLKVAESRSRSWETGIAKDESAAQIDGTEELDDAVQDGHASDGGDVGDLELAAISCESSVGLIRNVCDAVTPLADKTYEEQLGLKRDTITQVLKRLVRNTRKGIPSGSLLPDWITSARDKGGLPCALEGVLASPIVDGYRNKCEFSIGCSAQGDRVVGFQMGSFREGILTVAEPTDCRNVSHIARSYAAAFQEFVRKSELPVWNKKNNSGFWRLLIVREGRAARAKDNSGGSVSPISEVMLVIQVCPTGVSEENRNAEYSKMADVLWCAANSATPPLPLTALLVQNHEGISNVASSDAPLHTLGISKSEHIIEAPNGYIHDHIGELQFRISPTAFFQVNTLAAERLYSLAGDWAGLSPDTLLFDVCCGTGTIGLTLAHRVGLVVGIEMNASAVADAEKNAEINNITNCRFVCSKAEDVMESLLREYMSSEDGDPISTESKAGTLEAEHAIDTAADGVQLEPILCIRGKQPLRKLKNIVAIVDPPRVGLHPVVLKTLRLHTELRRLVYISCNPETLLANAVELCTPLSEQNSEKGKAAWRGRVNWKGLSNVGQARQRVKKMPVSEPFKPVKAIAVDLFPHTVHCEMVMLFER